MSKSTSSTKSRFVRAGIATGAAATLLLAASTTAAFAATLPMTLSQNSGPSGGGNTITGTVTPTTTSPAPFTAAVTPAVTFQYVGAAAAATCSPTYVAAAPIAVNTANPPVQTAGVLVVPAADVKKLTTTKLAITVPSSVVLTANSATPPVTQTSARYNICVYSGTTVTVGATPGSPLIANAPYTIAGAPTVTSITPSSGPALGGTQITVVGTGFSAGTTASVGGTPLTNIVVAPNGLSFTATTPAHAAGTDLPLMVTSTGGRVTPTVGVGALGIDYTFSNGITVAPNTAPPATNVDLDIMGVGFLGMTFSSAALAVADPTTGTGAHVYLVDGVYSPAPDATTPTNKAEGPVAECENVLTISDNELICTLQLGDSVDATGVVDATDVPPGAYTVAVVNNGALDVQAGGGAAFAGYQQSEITSGATFTVSSY